MREHINRQSKTFLQAVLVFFLASALLRCGGDSDTHDSSVQGSTSQQERKTFVITNNNGVPEDDKERLVEQNLMKKMFEKKYPYITLEYDTWVFDPESFIAKMAGKTATDVIGVFATEGAKVIEKKLAADITELVRNWELYPYVNKELIAPFTREDRMYGVPFGGMGGAYVMTLFYNKEMFKKAGIVDESGAPLPPQTWQEFLEVAQKLTDQEKGVAGFGILGDAQASGWHFLNWVWQSGGEFEKKIGARWVAVFDSPEAIRALQFIKDLRWKYNVLQRDITANNDDMFELFVSERIAMAIFTPEYLFYIVEKLKFPIEKIGICLLPAGPAGRFNQMGGSFLILNPLLPPEEQEAAFNVITYNFDLEWIEAACKLRQEQGRLVGIPSLPVFIPEYQQKIDAIIDSYRNVPSFSELMAEAVQYVRPEPPFYAQNLYSQYLSPAVQKVLTDEKADPEKIMKEATKDFQARFLDKMKL